MDEKIKYWWSTWAPFWDLIENRHFSTMITDFILDKISSPVLVIGAGQGIIVRYLIEKEYSVTGLDINDDMIKIAKEKYNLDIIKGDANDLPFQDNFFGSVIISSGVVDYGAGKDSIKNIINQAKRVLTKDGNLFAAFYQVIPQIEEIYKKIGVIDSENNYRMKRIFEIDRITKFSPLHCIFPIMKWTKKNFFKVIYEWTLIGLNLPKELKNERDKFMNILKMGKPIGITEKMLLESMPESVPYWSKEDIENLFTDLEIRFSILKKFSDCFLVQLW